MMNGTIFNAIMSHEMNERHILAYRDGMMAMDLILHPGGGLALTEGALLPMAGALDIAKATLL
jgi:hypothetical protein